MSINGPSYEIRKIIDGRIYDTKTAKRVLHLDCHRFGDDFEWENTDVYLSPKGQWFLAGRGNALSRWATRQVDGPVAGDGIELLNEDEVKVLFQQYDGPYEVYFEVIDG